MTARRKDLRTLENGTRTLDLIDGSKSSDKGHGVIKCGVCAEPVRDHEIGPCPELKGEVIYITEKRPRKTRKDKQ